ncbi:MAG TPA: triose-phosphate isomerase [Thiotrichaceae bacterium]|jgi:triosephosphate isomerase|nr:triose-phosphate isomerase [Thiotrichaceae bacterium]HIM07808.1 triose-phosphate isomerase [Gammaproteobacteria bacterium]
MTERQILVAANWKMNGTLETIRPLLQSVIQGVQGTKSEVVICPSSVYISELATLLQQSEIKLGAQNVSQLEKGAYTGEVSALMLKDFGCGYVIVGHSERRALYAENDVMVAKKFMAVQKNGMTPILCVGELLEERESNCTEEVIARQLDVVIELAGIAAFENAVIAYEPVWAIGTGKTATPEQAEEVHEFIRLRLARHDNEVADIVRILYGGSVNAGNAEQLFEMANIDGGLIGGASLVAEDFLTICRAMR